jgi:hypothetical protein
MHKAFCNAWNTSPVITWPHLKQTLPNNYKSNNSYCIYTVPLARNCWTISISLWFSKSTPCTTAGRRPKRTAPSKVSTSSPSCRRSFGFPLTKETLHYRNPHNIYPSRTVSYCKHNHRVWRWGSCASDIRFTNFSCPEGCANKGNGGSSCPFGIVPAAGFSILLVGAAGNVDLNSSSIQFCNKVTVVRVTRVHTFACQSRQDGWWREQRAWSWRDSDLSSSNLWALFQSSPQSPCSSLPEESNKRMKSKKNGILEYELIHSNLLVCRCTVLYSYVCYVKAISI